MLRFSITVQKHNYNSLFRQRQVMRVYGDPSFQLLTKVEEKGQILTSDHTVFSYLYAKKKT